MRIFFHLSSVSNIQILYRAFDFCPACMRQVGVYFVSFTALMPKSNSWIYLKSTPFSSRCVVKECRSACPPPVAHPTIPVLFFPHIKKRISLAHPFKKENSTSYPTTIFSYDQNSLTPSIRPNCIALSRNPPGPPQQFQAEINAYLKQEKKQLTDADIANYAISDQYTNRETGVTYTYLHQQVGGLRIFNAVSTMALRDGSVLHFANRFHANAAGKVNATQPVLKEQQAIEAAATHLGLTLKETPRFLNKETQRQRSTFSRGGMAREDITVELLYLCAGQHPALGLERQPGACGKHRLVEHPG